MRDDQTPDTIPAKPRARGIYLLPNLFTSGGLFAGFFAIIAAILDGVDGRVARMTNTQSEFGVQYDSLADLVSFGMAPARSISSRTIASTLRSTRRPSGVQV